jgi:hypothetical protein
MPFSTGLFNCVGQKTRGDKGEEWDGEICCEVMGHCIESELFSDEMLGVWMVGLGLEYECMV